jgi:hypothetical protein
MCVHLPIFLITTGSDTNCCYTKRGGKGGVNHYDHFLALSITI